MARKYETPEQARDAKREQTRIRLKKRRDAAAIAAGREPGRVGGPVKHRTDEERKEARRLAYQRWRERNIEYVRTRDAEIQRRKRRERAEAERRKLQKVGGDPKLTPEERRERARLNSLSYRRKYPERGKRQSDQYYAENKPLFRIKESNRRARKKGKGGTHTKEDIDLLWELQRGKCAFCLKPLKRGSFHIDHFIPLARGGTNDRSNLRLLHKKCNLEKASTDPFEHAQRNGLLCW
jgi:5-methylcytosine-specific restriction endonuclease McrA